MSSTSHLYSDFSSINPVTTEKNATAIDEAAQRSLEVYETGYDAGWNDAVTAQAMDKEKLTEEFIDRLQDISFTYHEAQNKLAQGLKSLLMQFVTSLMPQAAHHGLGLQLIEQITTLINSQSENRIELAVAPDRHHHLEMLLRDRLSVPFSITPDPELSSEQAYLRVNDSEREINLDGVIESVKTAVEAAYHSINKET